ncbi:FecR family protein [Sphingobacterium sp. LRF_L2]|uniref:FecR family protein n=1 Tax=Sphingobacterium sp. LRF_L2 TaxID=3369421 RepID=UPI003F63235E
MESTSVLTRLIKHYLEGKLSSEESDVLDRWRQESSENEIFFQKIVTGEEVFEDALSWLALHQDDGQAWLSRLQEDTLRKIQQKNQPLRKANRPYFLFTAIAALLLAVSLFGYFQFRQQEQEGKELDLSSVQAGTNKAELLLSNGKKINLRNDKDGIIFDKKLTYSDGTPLLTEDLLSLQHTMATILVPKGGKYKVTLSDGSKIQLNAQSKLVYPLVFEKNRREVQLEGEAYFDVAKVSENNKRVPFEVHCKDQKIEVTGTSFNVSAYPDDIQTVTTLVEGSVNVETAGQQLNLAPNQQAISQYGRIQKKEVDVHEFIAWTANKFLFYETELHDLMKSLGRWYAIDITYQGKIAPSYFYGEIGRDKNLEEALRIIEKSGVKFKLQQRGNRPPNLIVIQ